MSRFWRRNRRAFTLAETMLALFLVGLTMGFLGLLFQRSLEILRTIDDKERARQAGRMGLDRLTSELREATLVTGFGSELIFEKIDPNAVAVDPPPVPDDDDLDGFVPAPWTPQDAYPDSSRLVVRYFSSEDSLFREVSRKGTGEVSRQVVVDGVNSITATQAPGNDGEIEIAIGVRDNRKMVRLSSRVLCPCIKEPFR